MKIGGTLTNSSTNGNGLDIGNTGITSADTVTVNGAGGLINGSTSEINIEGSASVRATLNVANAAAGFGSGKGVETGTVVLENDALLEFKTGSITTINGNLTLDGASAHVADAGKLTSNSALTGLTSVTDIFRLENGAKVATNGNLSITGNAIVSLDGPDRLRRRRHQPDDRREADQQQHQRQWTRHRQHRHRLGGHFDGERGGRAVQWQPRARSTSRAARPFGRP